MANHSDRDDRLTQYERAVCFYTLPRVTRPLTYGLIVAYAVCLAEALGATVFGLLTGNNTWTTVGTVCLVALVVFGMVVFTIRTFLNDLRQRRALAEARNVPDAPDSDLPDPFADHILLRHPRDSHEHVFTCDDEDAHMDYRIAPVPQGNGRLWSITLPDGREVCDVRHIGGTRSFSLGGSPQGTFLVSHEGVELARVSTRGFSFNGDRTDVRILSPQAAYYRVEHRCIYHQDRLVGRIYYVRRSLYLDIEAKHFNLGILAYYAVAL